MYLRVIESNKVIYYIIIIYYIRKKDIKKDLETLEDIENKKKKDKKR